MRCKSARFGTPASHTTLLAASCGRMTYIADRLDVLGHMVAAGAALLTLAAIPAHAAAQTDYYNTDAGRPVQIEDAYPVERRAFEVQAAPLRLERSRGGVYNWGIEPEIAYGILPRTQIEIGAPLAYVDAGLGDRTVGLAGIDLSILHNLNVETSIPALALSAGVLLPAGNLGPDEVYPSVKGILTRTYTWARVHVNGEFTFGDRLPARVESSGAGSGGNDERDDASIGPQALELSQWLVGVAVDRTFPLRAFLVTGEVYAREPLRDGEDVEWNAGAGLRFQLSPRFSADAGVGRRLTGDERGWYATVGTAIAFGLPWQL